MHLDSRKYRQLMLTFKVAAVLCVITVMVMVVVTAQDTLSNGGVIDPVVASMVCLLLIIATVFAITTLWAHVRLTRLDSLKEIIDGLTGLLVQEKVSLWHDYPVLADGQGIEVSASMRSEGVYTLVIQGEAVPQQRTVTLSEDRIELWPNEDLGSFQEQKRYARALLSFLKGNMQALRTYS